MMAVLILSPNKDTGVRALTVTCRAVKAPLCLGTYIFSWPKVRYRDKKMLEMHATILRCFDL